MPQFLSYKITASKDITKRLGFVYSLKETIVFPEANRNYNGLGEPEQLIIIQPPKTALHGCKKFLSPISGLSLKLPAALGTISKITMGPAFGQAFEEIWEVLSTALSPNIFSGLNKP